MNPTDFAPTEVEWAHADVKVIRVGEDHIIGLRKDLEKRGVGYSQTLWFTLSQLRAVALDVM